MARITLQIPDGAYCSDKCINSCLFQQEDNCRLFDEELRKVFRYKVQNSYKTTHEKCNICKFFIVDNNTSNELENVEEVI